MRYALAIVALLLAAPATAAGAVRHAAPSGVGTLCSEAEPCSLATATGAGASSGDELVLAAGTYTVSGGGVGSESKDLAVRGAGGQAAPLLVATTSAGTCALHVGPGSEVRGVDVRIDSATSRGICARPGTTLERVRVTGNASGARGIVAAAADDLLLRDSYVRLTGPGAVGVRLHDFDGARVRNATISVTGLESTAVVLDSATSAGTASVRNTIVSATGPSFDLGCDGHAAQVTVDHSAYTAAAAGCTLTAGAGNVLGANVLLAPDNVSQQTASATVDAGLADADTGLLDLEGDPRTMGDGIDIGADEYRAAPSAVTGGANDVTTTAATLTGTVDGRGAAISYRFQYGKTDRYGGTTATVAGDDGVVSAAIDGLEPNTTYHYRVVALNPYGGVTNGPDQTFTTVGLPGGSVGGEDPDYSTGGGAIGFGPSGGGSSGGGSGGGAVSPYTNEPPAGTRSDVAPPVCRGLALKRRKRRATLTGACSEAVRLTLAVKTRGRRRARTVTVDVPGGTFKVKLPAGRIAQVKVTAKDAAGNAAPNRTLR